MGCWDRYGIWGFPKAFLKYDYPNSWMVYIRENPNLFCWMNRGVPRYPYDLGNLPWEDAVRLGEGRVSGV